MDETSFDVWAIVAMVIAALGGVVGWAIKSGFKRLEAAVAASSNKVDDEALKVVKDALRGALVEPPPPNGGSGS